MVIPFNKGQYEFGMRNRSLFVLYSYKFFSMFNRDLRCLLNMELEPFVKVCVHYWQRTITESSKIKYLPFTHSQVKAI